MSLYASQDGRPKGPATWVLAAVVGVIVLLFGLCGYAIFTADPHAPDPYFLPMPTSSSSSPKTVAR